MQLQSCWMWLNDMSNSVPPENCVRSSVLCGWRDWLCAICQDASPYGLERSQPLPAWIQQSYWMNSWPENVLGQQTPGGKQTLCYNGIYFQPLWAWRRNGWSTLTKLLCERSCLPTHVFTLTDNSFVIIFPKALQTAVFVFCYGGFPWHFSLKPPRVAQSLCLQNVFNSSFNHGGISPVWFQILRTVDFMVIFQLGS